MISWSGRRNSTGITAMRTRRLSSRVFPMKIRPANRSRPKGLSGIWPSFHHQDTSGSGLYLLERLWILAQPFFSTRIQLSISLEERDNLRQMFTRVSFKGRCSESLLMRSFRVHLISRPLWLEMASSQWAGILFKAIFSSVWGRKGWSSSCRRHWICSSPTRVTSISSCRRSSSCRASLSFLSSKEKIDVGNSPLLSMSRG